jgi:uncharacterized protein YjfI (DUF2170 family)
MSWDLSQLEELLAKRDGWAVHVEGGCLCVTNGDGLDAYVAVSGEQIVVESALFAKNQVNDVAGLNEEILKTHQLFPLTTMAITTIDSEEYYMCFGALSAQSKPESVMIEVETLFDNVAGFLDAYETYLN